MCARPSAISSMGKAAAKRPDHGMEVKNQQRCARRMDKDVMTPNFRSNGWTMIDAQLAVALSAPGAPRP